MELKTDSLERVQKMTGKGQITLPHAWRKAVGTQNVIVRVKGHVLTVQPARFAEAHNETIIFNAERDNNGKGIPASELIATLEKLIAQDEKVRKTNKKSKTKR